jgi:hypothetical protein
VCAVPTESAADAKAGSRPPCQARVCNGSPPRCRDEITDRSDNGIRLIERKVIAAVLGHNLPADTRRRDQFRLIGRDKVDLAEFEVTSMPE